MNDSGGTTERIIRGVVAQAVQDAAAGGVLVLEDWTPEGELAYEWLVLELGEERVWRAASARDKLQGGVAAADAVADATPFRDSGLEAAAAAAGLLLAHPANKSALVLGGRLPRADLLPLGDVWASHVERLTGRWSAPAEVEDAAVLAGGITPLDAALERLIDGREDAAAALASLPAAAAHQVVALYERGRFYRVRPRLVPKLGARTLGMDLFD